MLQPIWNVPKMQMLIYLYSDMKTIIEVENIKCGGCANSIRREIGTIQGVFSVDVNFIDGIISVDHTDEVERKTIADRLLKMGYPEKGSVEGFEALKAGAKSFVSCAIGKLSKE